MSGLDRRLRERMVAMPEMAPPDALADRIARGQRARVRRLGAVGATVALALAWVAALGPSPGGPAPGGPVPVAAIAAPADTLADVRALDRALQAAYERNASDDEIAPLWAARARLLGPTAVPAGI